MQLSGLQGSILEKRIFKDDFKDTADLYMTQVGLNLVAATVESDAGTIPLEAPFIAYGKPDAPHHLLKAFPEEGRTVTALVNNPAGSLRVIVADQYQNPISNLDILFNSLPAAPSPTPLSPPRNIQFYKPDECPNPYPLFGDCPTTETLTIKTQYFGAMVNTILGNTVNTQYKVQVITANLDSVTFTLFSDGFREPGTYIAPSLYLRSLQIVDDKGNPVNAAKAGTRLSAPLVSELFELSDEYTMEEGSLCRDTGLPNCWRVKASGLVNITPIDNGSVEYQRVEPTVSQPGEIPTENVGNGKYQSPYTTAPTPGKNLVEATGSATLTVPVVYYNPVTSYADTEGYVGNTLSTAPVLLQSGQSVLFDRNTQAPLIPDVVHKALYTVYGVDIQLTVDPSVIVLNDAGRTTRNVAFRYTILPGEYEPNLVMIELYRGTSRPNIPGEGWEGYILGDKGIPVAVGSGTERRGSAVLSAGSPFDITLFYAAEATLNRGTATEIRSGTERVVSGVTEVQRTDVPIAKIQVKSNEMASVLSSSVDQIRFGNGTQDAKTYRIEFQSKVLFESCGNLLGTLHAITKAGVLVKPPDDPQNDRFPRTSYPLDFRLDNGQCRVKVDDSVLTSSDPKDRFILSNRSLGLLGVTDKAVLYGGLGNQVEVDINGAKKEIPIEPVEVIVLGIDGLRQDVLYDSTEASYSDSIGCGGSPCYVDRATLPGLSQILTEAGTIKLRDVTAVFPSITLTSWASIFTGKMPKETGILGNEFFARDLNISVPEKYSHPSGIISFGSGAFPGYDAFGNDSLRGPLGFTRDDFFVPMKAGWAEGVPANRGPQNRSDVLGAKTIYESINEIPGLKSSFETRGGDPSVAAYSHYSRGAHWITWDIGVILNIPRALDRGSWDKLDEYLDGRYCIGFCAFLGKRNDIPFSALTTWYLSGLDHEAHEKGMGVYRDYFIETTDFYIGETVKLLKGLDEFDDKIFIITSDHGATGMPYDYTVGITNPATGQVKTVMPETSCELIFDKFDTFKVQAPEQANNNLHIWELAEVMKSIGEDGWEVYKILAPPEITKLYIQGEEGQSMTLPYGATDSLTRANVIAALNGPMAHVYLKTQNGWQDPNTDIVALARLAAFLKAYLIEGGGDLKKADQDKFRRLLSSVDFILIREGGEYKKFRGVQTDGAGDIIGADTEPIGETTFDRFQYIQALDRMKGLNHPNRSGDLVLVFKDFMGGSPLDRYTSGVPCKAWHGSLNPTDSYVPFIVAYPGGNKQELESVINQESVCPGRVCEGNWKAADLILELVRRQYLKN